MKVLKTWESDETTVNLTAGTALLMTDLRGIEIYGHDGAVNLPAGEIPFLIQALQEAQAFIEGAQGEI